MEGLKQALERKAGSRKTRLWRRIISIHARHHDDRERVVDLRCSCGKAFKEAYPDENVGLAVLLQTFLSGASSFYRSPGTVSVERYIMDKAIEEAVTVEEALHFGGSSSAEDVPC